MTPIPIIRYSLPIRHCSCATISASLHLHYSAIVIRSIVAHCPAWRLMRASILIDWIRSVPSSSPPPPLLVPNPRLGTSGLGPGRRCRPRVRITSIVPFPDWSRPTPCVHCCLPWDVGAIRASYLCLRRAPCPVPAPRSQLAYCVPRVVYRCPLVCIYDMPSGSWFTGTG